MGFLFLEQKPTRHTYACMELDLVGIRTRSQDCSIRKAIKIYYTMKLRDYSAQKQGLYSLSFIVEINSDLPGKIK